MTPPWSPGRWPRRGGQRVPPEVVARAGLPAGEKVLAATRAEGGAWLLGTRRLLVLLLDDETVVLPWEQVEDASWDRDEERFRLSAVGEFGRPRPSYELVVAEPARLLELVRERVTSSIVLQRRVPVRGRLGLSVIGRRSPAGGPITWLHAYDQGLDPDDPEVVVTADLALAQARSEVGDSI